MSVSHIIQKGSVLYVPHHLSTLTHVVLFCLYSTPVHMHNMHEQTP